MNDAALTALAWMAANQAAADFLAAPFTAFVAVLGWVATHQAGLQRQRMKARLEFVSLQLERLYGPLYSLVAANNAAFEAFRKVHPSGSGPRTPEEKRGMQVWAREVFIPSNLKIRDVIEKNAHLLVDGAMPDCFRRMLAHAESSKLALEALEIDDLSMLDAFEPWPKDFNRFIEDAYFAISQEHARLLGRLRR